MLVYIRLTMRLDLLSRARAMATNCLCPWEKFAPPELTSVVSVTLTLAPALLGAGEAVRLGSASSLASWDKRVLEGTRDGARETAGVSRGPRLTRDRASRSSSSVCSLKGSRFSRTVPENRTASTSQLRTRRRICRESALLTLWDVRNSGSL